MDMSIRAGKHLHVCTNRKWEIKGASEVLKG